MVNETFQKYQCLHDYLANVYKLFPQDNMPALEAEDPAYYAHIVQSEQELARLKTELFKEQDKRSVELKMDLSHAEQMTMDSLLFPAPVVAPKSAPRAPVASNPALTAALPTPPAQTTQQQLQATTIFTPLPSIVSDGYERRHSGINWPHYENMLKLYALNLITRGRTLTPEQQQDKAELEEAIVAAEEARQERALAQRIARGKGPKKPKEPVRPALQDVLKQFENNRYIEAGHNVIHARVLKMDTMEQVDFRIQHTINDNNSQQLDKVKQKALAIIEMMRVRYKKAK